MIRSMYTAATGMKSQQLYMDTISNNLSNVNTNSYKKQSIQFKDLMYQTLKEPGVRNPEGTMAPAGIEVGLGVRPAAIQRNFSQGSLKNTGNNYDMAIEGEGFFQIEMPNGAVAYSRDGQFERSYDGTLVTSDGYAVYPRIVVPEDMQSISVSREGYVMASTGGADDSDSVELGQLELARFVNPTGLKALGSNLFAETDSSGAPQLGVAGEDGIGTVAHQYTEASNVEMVDEMVGMISAQRAYEIVSKAITVSEDMLQTASNLKR